MAAGDFQAAAGSCVCVARDDANGAAVVVVAAAV